MRIEEAVQFMSKAYLHRIIDSFTKDLHKPDVEPSRDLIIRNAKELADFEHIKTKLARDTLFHEQVLTRALLKTLLQADERICSESDIIEQTQQAEQDVIDRARDGNRSAVVKG